jgi:hypothetical protein
MVLHILVSIFQGHINAHMSLADHSIVKIKRRQINGRLEKNDTLSCHLPYVGTMHLFPRKPKREMK